MLWRSGVALAAELDGEPLAGVRVVEIGCGLGLPSLVAARSGARVLASDGDPEALALLGRNAELNGVRIETAVADWADPGELIGTGPYDLALAADVLYENRSAGQLAALLPRLAPEALLADPGRPALESFIERLALARPPATTGSGVVTINRLRLA